MMRKLCSGAILLLSLVGAAALWAQTLPPGVTAGPSAQGITEYRLANGLVVLLFPESSKPTVTVNVTYLVGDRYAFQTTRANLAAALRLSAHIQRDPAFPEPEFETALRGLTVTRINAALKQHFDFTQLTVIKAGDMKRLQN